MTSRQNSRTIFFTCLLLAFSSVAKAQTVVQCIDEAGAVTFTDVPCKTAGDAARGIDSIEISGLESQAMPHVKDLRPGARNFAAAEEIRAAAWAKKRPASRTFALDAAMLQAAKIQMISTQLVRKQVLVQPPPRYLVLAAMFGFPRFPGRVL